MKRNGIHIHRSRVRRALDRAYVQNRSRSVYARERSEAVLASRASLASSLVSANASLGALGGQTGSVYRGVFFLEVSFLFASTRRYRAYISGMQFLSRTQEKRASVTSLRLSSAHWNAHARDSASPPMPHPERRERKEKEKKNVSVFEVCAKEEKRECSFRVSFRVPREPLSRDERTLSSRTSRGRSERAARRGGVGASADVQGCPAPTHRSRTARLRGRSCPSGTS